MVNRAGGKDARGWEGTSVSIPPTACGKKENEILINLTGLVTEMEIKKTIKGNLYYLSRCVCGVKVVKGGGGVFMQDSILSL